MDRPTEEYSLWGDSWCDGNRISIGLAKQLRTALSITELAEIISYIYLHEFLHWFRPSAREREVYRLCQVLLGNEELLDTL